LQSKIKHVRQCTILAENALENKEKAKIEELTSREKAVLENQRETEIHAQWEESKARVEEAESRLLQISQDHASKLAALQTVQQELRAVEHFANNECSWCHAAFASARNEPCGHRLMCVPCNGEYRITNGDNREEYVHYMFIRDRQTDRLQTADNRRQTADGRRDL
jgi:hypothetical protein